MADDADDGQAMVLKEIYLHQNQLNNGISEIFQIFELAEDAANPILIRPAISTNCLENEEVDWALEQMNIIDEVQDAPTLNNASNSAQTDIAREPNGNGKCL